MQYKKVKNDYHSGNVLSYFDMSLSQSLYFEFIRSIGVRTVAGREFNLLECSICGMEM